MLAIKYIPESKINDERLAEIRTNMKTIATIKHKNIVQLYDAIRTTNSLYFMMEYCNGGDLYNYRLKQGGKLTEVEAKKFLKDIVAGYYMLYNLGIIHQNFKPENILIHDGVAKIADFFYYPLFDFVKCKTLVGTHLFVISQEILNGEKFSSKCDLWSLGVIYHQCYKDKLLIPKKPDLI